MSIFQKRCSTITWRCTQCLFGQYSQVSNLLKCPLAKYSVHISCSRFSPLRSSTDNHKKNAVFCSLLGCYWSGVGRGAGQAGRSDTQVSYTQRCLLDMKDWSQSRLMSVSPANPHPPSVHSDWSRGGKKSSFFLVCDPGEIFGLPSPSLSCLFVCRPVNKQRLC